MTTKKKMGRHGRFCRRRRPPYHCRAVGTAALSAAAAVVVPYLLAVAFLVGRPTHAFWSAAPITIINGHRHRHLRHRQSWAPGLAHPPRRRPQWSSHANSGNDDDNDHGDEKTNDVISSRNDKKEYRVVILGKIIVDEYGPPPPSGEGSNGDGGSGRADGDDGSNGDGSSSRENDEPKKENKEKKTLTIGGGGPQAAWGAAAALAARDYHRDYDSTPLLQPQPEGPSATSASPSAQPPPPPSQPITFLAPVGSDWSTLEQSSLNSLLHLCLDTPPILIRGDDDSVTPRIRLWHDAKQNVQWFPLNGSFGMRGADGLWRDRPSAADVLRALDKAYDDDAADDGDASSDDGGSDDDGGNKENDNYQETSSKQGKQLNVVLHGILESGSDPPGDRLDALPFFDPKLRSLTSFIGIEPVVFPEELTGTVSKEDAEAFMKMMRELVLLEETNGDRQGTSFFISPDSHLMEALPDYFFTSLSTDKDREDSEVVSLDVAARAGPEGSIVNGHLHVPAATLFPNAVDEKERRPVNPTGAGNAYAAAFSACLGTGSTVIEAACYATAVGAVVCEYDHLPPWNYDTISRICQAKEEVRTKIRKGMLVKEAAVEEREGEGAQRQQQQRLQQAP